MPAQENKKRTRTDGCAYIDTDSLYTENYSCDESPGGQVTSSRLDILFSDLYIKNIVTASALLSDYFFKDIFSASKLVD